MKFKTLALTSTLVCIAYSAHAQQSMPGMPGMKMDPPPTVKSKSTPTLTPPNPANPRAAAAAASVQQSVQQQAAQPQTPPAPDSDAASIKVPIQDLQEPEAIGFHTGSDLPAPDLLHAVADQPPMTLEAFLDLAARNNPTLAQAQLDADRSRQQARQVSLPPDPFVGYSGDHIRGGSYHGGEQGAFFSQEFVLGRKLALRRDVYRAEAGANDLAIDIQRARIRNDVGHAFIDALAAQQTVMIQDRLLKVALDTVTNAHELERVGQADATAVLTAEIAAEQAKIDFVDAQRAFLSSFAQLASLAGQPTLSPHPLTGALAQPPELDPKALVDADTQQSPAVKQAQANVAVAEARVRSAQRERIPNLTLKAGEWYSGEELGSTTRKAGFETFVEAGVQLPLWNRNQGNVAAARIILERSRQDVTRTQLLTRNRTDPLAQQYETARYTAQKYRTEMIPRARRAYELEVTKYQQMAQSYPHVLSTQHLLFTLQLGYVKALQQQWQAAISLENSALMNALDAPMSTGQDSTTMNIPTSPGASN